MILRTCLLGADVHIHLTILAVIQAHDNSLLAAVRAGNLVLPAALTQAGKLVGDALFRTSGLVTMETRDGSA